MSVKVRPGDHFESIRTARKEHRCEDCRGWIKPGERYARLSLSPSAEFGVGRWWCLNVHVICPSGSEIGSTEPDSMLHTHEKHNTAGIGTGVDERA